MLFYLLINVLVGAAAGIIAGLLGTGNSLVVLPALIFILPNIGVAPDIALPLAVGTNLAICGISILVANINHRKHIKIDWKILQTTGPAYFTGSLLGPWVAKYIPRHTLKDYIALFILFAAFTLIFKAKPQTEDHLPSRKNLFISSLIVSFLSSISGMASGILMVPYLTWINVPIKKAISIALPCAVIFSFTAMAGYIISGWNNPYLPKWSLGYVYLPTTIIISIVAASCSSLGVKLHHRIDMEKVKKLFVLLLIIAAFITLKG